MKMIEYETMGNDFDFIDHFDSLEAALDSFEEMQAEGVNINGFCIRESRVIKIVKMPKPIIEDVE